MIGNAVPISESLEGAAVAEDYSNQLAVRHQVRQVLLAALARVGIWGKADRVKVVAYGFRQDGDFVLLLPHVTMSHKPLHRHSSSEIKVLGGETMPGVARPERGSAPSGYYVLQLQEHRLRERFGTRPMRLISVGIFRPGHFEEDGAGLPSGTGRAAEQRCAVDFRRKRLRHLVPYR